MQAKVPTKQSMKTESGKKSFKYCIIGNNKCVNITTDLLSPTLLCSGL